MGEQKTQMSQSEGCHTPPPVSHACGWPLAEGEKQMAEKKVDRQAPSLLQLSSPIAQHSPWHAANKGPRSKSRATPRYRFTPWTSSRTRAPTLLWMFNIVPILAKRPFCLKTRTDMSADGCTLPLLPPFAPFAPFRTDSPIHTTFAHTRRVLTLSS